MRIYVDNPYFIDFLELLQRWCSVCGLAKIFFTSEFSYLLFCNSTHKTETGTQQISNGGTTDSKPHGPIIMMGQSRTLSSSHIIFITFVSAGAQHWLLVGWSFTSHGKLYNYAEPKPFSWSKPAHFDFSSSNFTVRGDILSTPGDALTQLHIHFQNNFDYFSRKANDDDDVAG